MKESGVFERAFAKVNLALNVGGIRADGYHEVTMILQQVDVWDEIDLYKRPRFEASLECNLPYLVKDERNLAVKAVRLLQKTYGIGGVHVRLFKKIPVAAGMAGGSADAAAVLRGASCLYGLDLPDERLMKLAQQLGSDVPYCVIGGTCLAEGRGEKLTRIDPFPEALCILVKPNFGISTPWSYQQYHVTPDNPPADIDGMIEAMKASDLAKSASMMRNQLEKIAVEHYPVLGRIESTMMDLGALGARMTGSGPTVFGIFDDALKAQKALMTLRRQLGRMEIIMCRIGGKDPYHGGQGDLCEKDGRQGADRDTALPENGSEEDFES